MEKTLVVWRRLGKEHGKNRGFRVNTPDVVKRHLREKVERFRATADCYVMRDLFCDVLVKANCSDYTVMDLDELGRAHQLGLVTGDDVLTSLTSTQELIDQIRGGAFPPPEVTQCQEAIKSLRWGSEV